MNNIHAEQLPPGSVVATDDVAYIRHDQPAGQPAWVGTDRGDYQADTVIDFLLRNRRAHLLRDGYNKPEPL